MLLREKRLPGLQRAALQQEVDRLEGVLARIAPEGAAPPGRAAGKGGGAWDGGGGGGEGGGGGAGGAGGVETEGRVAGGRGEWGHPARSSRRDGG